ncbi:MAG: hypothetical protein WD512_01715 [Candidatus Paceibacterota bacterium]
MSDDDDNHFYIELGKLDQNQPIRENSPTDQPSNNQLSSDHQALISNRQASSLSDTNDISVARPIKVDMSEIVTSLNEFSNMVKYRKFGGGGEMAGWNAAVCMSFTLASITIIVLIVVFLYLRENPSKETICNCKCDYPLISSTSRSSTSGSSTQFMDSNITLSTVI